MRSEGGQRQQSEDRNLLFEQGEECPARGGIRAGRRTEEKQRGIKLAQLCWEGWGGGARPLASAEERRHNPGEEIAT